VKPEVILLGKIYFTKNNKLIEKQQMGYFVPFKKSLEKLLNMPEVWAHIDKPHYSGNEFMYDICDGDYIRNSHAVQVILNTDDLEIVNPLVTYIKKHKISMFYYTIANFPTQYR
jgi:hypothetical protein